MSDTRAGGRRGFSLFQLLLLLALLLIGFGLLLPAVRKTREAANRVSDNNNLRNIVLGTINCADSNNKLPPLAGLYPASMPGTPNNGDGTVFFHILPYVEQDNLYKSSLDVGGDNIATYRGELVRSSRIKLYQSPSDSSGGKDPVHDGWLAMTNYAANFQLFGDPLSNSLQGSAKYPASISDGTANTIMFTTRYQLCNGDPNGWGYDTGTPWAPAFAYLSKARFQSKPSADRCNSSLAQSLNEGGITVGLCDGRARVVSRTISEETWWAACTPAGNEVLGPDW